MNKEDERRAWVAGHSLEEAQAACDAALLAQGYVLDGDTP